MSAWLCSEDHINLLVNSSKLPTKKDFDMLVQENIRSLEERYPGRDFLDEWKTEAKKFKFKLVGNPGDLVFAAIRKQIKKGDARLALFKEGRSRVVATQIIKACDCYDYQACETDDYLKTPAAAYVSNIRLAHINSGSSKGQLYDALLWGI